jgi:hypothetical protein
MKQHAKKNCYISKRVLLREKIRKILSCEHCETQRRTTTATVKNIIKNSTLVYGIQSEKSLIQKV